MCVEIEIGNVQRDSACKGSGRECVCREREGVCFEIEEVCREIESACKGCGRESVCLEKERERWKVCADRGKACVLK